jgi:hypothetical protein
MTGPPQLAYDLDPVQPANQTAQHYYLCLKARQYLLANSAWCVGLEVGFEREHPDPRVAVFGHTARKIVDVVGVQMLYHATSRYSVPLMTKETWEPVSVAIEVKVSKSDLRAGFVQDACDFNYLCCLEGLTRPNGLPQSVGLMVWGQKDGIWELRMRKRAKRIESPRLPAPEATEHIAYCNATEMRSRLVIRVPNPFDPAEKDRLAYPLSRICPRCHNREELVRWLRHRWGMENVEAELLQSPLTEDSELIW